MAEPGALEKVVGEVGKLLLPLQDAMRSPGAFATLLRELGWDADVIPGPIAALTPDIDVLFDRLQKIFGSGLTADAAVSDDGAEIDVPLTDIKDAIEAVARLIQGIENLAAAPGGDFPPALSADNFPSEFPDQLLRYLFARYLERHQGELGFALKALGVIKTRYVDENGNRPAYVETRFDFADVPKLLSDPATLFRNAYGWGTDAFDVAAVFRAVDNLAANLRLDTYYEPIAPAAAAALEDGAPVEDNPVRRRLRLRFFERERASGELAADLSLFALPKNGALAPGLALLPSFTGMLDFRLEVGPNVAVIFASDLDLAGGVGILLRPDSGVEMVLGFNSPGAPTKAKGSARITVEYAPEDEAPTILLGNPGGMRLEFGSAGLTGGFLLDSDDGVDVFTEIETDGLAFVLEGGDADGFIKTILDGIDARFEADLALGLSIDRGVYFRGTSHLEIQVPAHLDLGPVEIQGLTIAVRPSGDGVPIDIGTTFKAQLGPLDAVVENIGLRTDLAFPGAGGNLGPLQLDFGVKPPNGIGLSLDAGAVKGGGYLFIDPDRGEYAGALELKILDFLSVTAIGIITTKLPDGSDGFTFLALINVQFNPGVQLGFGFTLLGVGGLVGLNRSMNLDALVEGARSGRLSSLLFPQDVVANATSIISDLKSFFPAEEGTFLVGPMTKFGWGTPTLISLSLGIIIEIPGNIAIVGKLTVAIPDERVPLIIINVAFMGAIEFDKKRGWFFANIYDSRVIYLTLEGGIGVLAAFGSNAAFILAVGGFHPAYNPPSLPFPPINRIGINILSTPVARIRVEGYFAITSNTVQFGARAELYFGIKIASIEGHLQFDALFQFSPFYFIISISASLSVKLFGAGLFSVRFAGSLEGTSPWHVEGTGSISILFWDVDVDFSHTWGEDEDTKLPPVSVLPILAAEYEKDENWTAELANQSQLAVSLATPSAADGLVLHPIGFLRITQRAVPLGITIDKLGAQRPDDANRFSVAPNTPGIAKRAEIEEEFATAQFRELSDTEKLNAADYQSEEAGLELSLSGPQANTSFVARRIARYETIIIDNKFKRAVFQFIPMLSGLFTFFLSGNAMAQAQTSQRVTQELQPFDDKFALSASGFVVANTADNTVFAGQPTAFASRARAEEALADAIAADPALASKVHILRPHEVAEAA